MSTYRIAEDARPGSRSLAAPSGSWPLNRILFLLAGSVTLTGVLLAATVSPWFLVLPAIAGANQLLMVATGRCPMSMLLTRLGVGTVSC